MQDYTLTVLYSGSTGNAALLTAGGISLLIDAGRSAKLLTAALKEAGVSPDGLSAIFLTHEHKDHTSALDVFLKNRTVPVHTTRASAEKLCRTASEAVKSNLVVHPPLFTEEVGPFTLRSFCTPHDSADSVGYRIRIRGEAVHEIGYVTDLGHVTPAVEDALLGCEAVVLECNHDEEMLTTGPYPYDLKRRIASRNGHLSNTDCAAFCVRLAESGTERFLLAHLSETNNLPELALSEVTATLAGYAVKIDAAAPDHAVVL